MNLKTSFILALLFGILAVAGWELYWRAKGVEPNLDDNKDLWVVERHKLEDDNKKQVVFIGSSRILFDIQKDTWKEHSNTEPIMLASQGATPLPILAHLVDDTNYRGLLIVGVSPDIFFWSDTETHFSWKRANSKVSYFKDQTYAQKINHKLSVPLQKWLAFYRDSDEEWDDNVDLATLLQNSRCDTRPRPLKRPFYNFETVQLNRNVEMSERATNDTAFANTVIHAWSLDEWENEINDSLNYKKLFKDGEKKRTTILDYFLKYADRYTSEGGKIVLVRAPSSGKYREMESRDFPRSTFWDSLVLKSELPNVHFEDYQQFTGLNLPELSHLSKKDAEYFTEEFIQILKTKGFLSD